MVERMNNTIGRDVNTKVKKIWYLEDMWTAIYFTKGAYKLMLGCQSLKGPVERKATY